MISDDVKYKIASEILELFHKLLSSDIAINKKSNTTLADSHLDKDAFVNPSNDGVFELVYNHYLQYIESGRKPYAKKVPISALIPWCEEKLGTNDNNVVYAVQNSIYKLGIEPRPILVYLDAELDVRWSDTWADEIFQSIIKILDDYFNGNN